MNNEQIPEMIKKTLNSYAEVCAKECIQYYQQQQVSESYFYCHQWNQNVGLCMEQCAQCKEHEEKRKQQVSGRRWFVMDLASKAEKGKSYFGLIEGHLSGYYYYGHDGSWYVVDATKEKNEYDLCFGKVTNILIETQQQVSPVLSDEDIEKLAEKEFDKERANDSNAVNELYADVPTMVDIRRKLFTRYFIKGYKVAKGIK